MLYRAARGAGLDPEAARDASRDCLLAFLARAEAFDGHSSLRTWLFGILYRKIRETQRQSQRDTEHDSIDEIVEQRFDWRGAWARPPADPSTDLKAEVLRGYLAECLEPIPARQLSALLLREVEDLTSDEICNVLEVSRTSLGVLLYRARHRSRECFESKSVRGSGNASL